MTSVVRVARSRRTWPMRHCALIVGVLCVATACATGDPDTTADREARSALLRVGEAWARPADSGATGGVYLTIRNADSVGVDLVGITTPFAVSAEVHESMNHDGMAHMMARPALAVPAQDSVVMQPGGLHVMLMELTRALAPGDSVPLTLVFSNGLMLPTTATVRAP